MKLFPTDEIMHNYKMFWQYPVITEKTFYKQYMNDDKYIGFPWATIIDKRYNLNVILKILKSHIETGVQYYTCCQHISFRNLISLFKELGIMTIYTPHKKINEDTINDIQVKPCPLYAVNIEDNERNGMFKNIDFTILKRKYLYSFQGAYHPSWYLTDIRKRIFEMKHPDNCYVNHIGNWHFDNVVYNKKQNNNSELNESEDDNERTRKYNLLLLDSRYSLCPSGSGPNSIRFWECLAVGSIPILLADTLELPDNELWEKAIVKIQEKDLEKIPKILSNIDDNKEKYMREKCMELYQYYRNNYKNEKQKTIFTSYKCSINNNIIKSILSKWTQLNPTIRILYFSDDNVTDFFKDTKYYNTYKNMKNGVAIADFFRICYINKYGGYWFDLDIEPIKLNLPTEGNIHLFDAGFNNISYMFIGGNPNQKLFNDVIEKVVININNNIVTKTQHIMDITGPRIIQNIICDKLNIMNKDGCLIAGNTSVKYLENTEYEFIYSKLNIIETKTNEYKLLQQKFNKKNYQYYNYV